MGTFENSDLVINLFKRILALKTPTCRVQEFENEITAKENDEPELYKRILSTMTNFDASKGIKIYDIVGHGMLKQIIRVGKFFPIFPLT